MDERNPKPGPTPSEDVPVQSYPGVESKMDPPADHGEQSYRGSGKLEGLVAIVTGGDSGIGRAVCIAFAREGADVAVGYLPGKEEKDAQETKRWVEEAGRRCLLIPFDVQQRAECQRLVEQVTTELGRLDILVNNAAYQMSRKSIEEYSEEQVELTFRTNIFGYFYMAQAAMPHLKPGAAIVNTGSITGMDGNPELLDYSATKGAIHAFTKALATNVAAQGIRVNCIAPGPVWTPLIPSTFDHEHVVGFGEDTVWKRPAQPAEIAPAYVFLASPDARYITGEVLAITGKSGTR
ncbi:MAG: SDR family oxidoreductase [Gemmatimonadetes bacterium]|nr:SDR family oxidoreductase [Gemmatimonadota bacterium]